MPVLRIVDVAFPPVRLRRHHIEQDWHAQRRTVSQLGIGIFRIGAGFCFPSDHAPKMAVAIDDSDPCDTVGNQPFTDGTKLGRWRGLRKGGTAGGQPKQGCDADRPRRAGPRICSICHVQDTQICNRSLCTPEKSLKARLVPVFQGQHFGYLELGRKAGRSFCC